MGGEAEAAVAIVHARGPEEAILLIRRATNPRDPWSGHWSFPGGRRDPEDVDLIATALRELREECSISLSRDALLQTLPFASAGRRVGRQVVVAPFAFEIAQTVPVIADGREAVEAIWTPVSMLKDVSRHARMPVPGLPSDMLWPSIVLGDVPLWGFTYRMICQWLAVPVEIDP